MSIKSPIDPVKIHTERAERHASCASYHLWEAGVYAASHPAWAAHQMARRRHEQASKAHIEAINDLAKGIEAWRLSNLADDATERAHQWKSPQPA